MTAAASVGDHLRLWRQRRRLSQLDCALELNVSQRHLSFIESGRSRPTRGMVLRLAECLEVPLRDRNAMLLAAGFAPAFPERRLDDPELAAARAAMERLLQAHEPYPALAVDRHWRMQMANRPALRLTEGIAEASLLEPPVNVLRLSLHPGGLAPRIRNLPVWRGHLLARLRHDAERLRDQDLADLLAELSAYPGGETTETAPGPLLPLEIEVAGRVLRLISTTTVFGAPMEVALSELAMESFFPADPETAALLSAL